MTINLLKIKPVNPLSIVFAFTVLIGLLSLPAYAQSASVKVVYKGMGVQNKELNYPAPVRLNQVLEDATDSLTPEQFAAINWSKSRLGSTKLQQQLEQKRKNVDKKLTQLELLWQRRGQATYRQGINYLRRQLNDLEFLPAYYVGLEFDRTRVNLQQNPILSSFEADTFVLFLATGSVQNLDLGLDKNSDAADDSFSYAIANNGDYAVVPSAYFNSKKTPHCYRHRVSEPFNNEDVGVCQQQVNTPIISLLRDRILVRGYQQLNQEIAELLKFAVGEKQ